MDFNQYIKNANQYGEVLTRWRVYLVALQEEMLSDKKKTIKIQAITDRTDLIRFNELEEYDCFTEIKTIHQLIKKEKEVYDNFIKLIKKPKNTGFFTFKNKAKALRNEKFEKIFKKLLSINSEQNTRLNLFIKNLELLAMKNAGDLAENKKEQEVKSSNKQDDSGNLRETEEKNTNIQEKEIATKKPETEKSKPIKDVSPENDDKSSEDFDYETEMKRILGL